ncbi:hypothetical protein A5821_001325 [Enterococcus sp. 7F3_DIV0205]|uniref:Uncharacterized protein n=1 Tax=Candidatus Enterococcus palustris TaxID=1834189 RepID=A0AAQ3WD64_9ENTE|nr:hypothetical protein A5821_001669 [Enterococcus sp. 7F3_DIV0205]
MISFSNREMVLIAEQEYSKEVVANIINSRGTTKK